MKSTVKDLANVYAKKYKTSVKDAETEVRAVLGILTDAIVDGGVSILGKFSIEVVRREERGGVNPRTGERVTHPACKTIKFKASKSLKEAVNK